MLILVPKSMLTMMMMVVVVMMMTMMSMMLFMLILTCASKEEVTENGSHAIYMCLLVPIPAPSASYLTLPTEVSSVK